jgi:hypothetical protein
MMDDRKIFRLLSKKSNDEIWAYIWNGIKIMNERGKKNETKKS